MTAAHTIIRWRRTAGIGAIALVLAANTAGWGADVATCTESALRLALAQDGNVALTCDGTITLTSPLIISNQVVIDGTGQNVSFTISGEHRLFHVEAGGDLTLVGLTLRGGRDIGTNGAMGMVQGQDGKPGERARGGAILINGGAVTIEDCVLRDHLAWGGDGGAGFDALGCEAPGEGANAGWGLGGAIYMVDGSLFIERSTLRNNTARGGRGGAGGAAATCVLGSDGASGGAGGHGYGGVVYVENGFLHMENCSLFENLAESGSGGEGGAAAGGFGSGGDGGIGALARGGTIFADRGKVTLLGCTMAYESTEAGFGGEGGLGGSPSLNGDRGSHGIWQGECLYGARTDVSLSHCIVDGTRRLRGCSGSVEDLGYNLGSDGSCGFDATGFNRTDPLLTGRFQIGSATLVLELLEASPAIDAGDSLTAPLLDQFGTSRVGPPDLGAFESLLGSVEIQVFALAEHIREGSTNALFDVCRTGPLQRPQSVFYRLEGTATNGTDYALVTIEASESQVVIPPNAECVTLEFAGLSDEMIEEEETVLLTLLEGPYLIGLLDAAQFLVRDNSHAPVIAGSWNEDQAFLVEFDAVSNLTYTLQYSSNFVDWSNLVSVVAGSNRISLLDLNVTNETLRPPLRFYRVMRE